MKTDNWRTIKRRVAQALLETVPFDAGEWQAIDVRGSKLHQTYEITDATIRVDEIPTGRDEWQAFMQPDLPWAEDHFLERVGRVPLNPPPASMYWPHAVRGNADHLDDGGKFDHTYPERFWPKWIYSEDTPEEYRTIPMTGIRFPYGDLDDVVNQFLPNPMTRQAYLPVWFPEDTGARDAKGGTIRVPCTLGYHFMVRPDANGVYRMSVRYYMRSCDAVRHFTNDVYLAGRLLQWVVDEVNDRIYKSYAEDVPMPPWFPLFPGHLLMHVASMHAFAADKGKLEAMVK